MTDNVCAVQQLIGLNNDDYLLHYFESGCRFAEFYYGGDRDVVLLLTQSAAFWAWYKKQYEQMDKLFIRKFKNTNGPQAVLYKAWLEHHSPDNLIAFPAQHAIEHELGKIWGQAWKEEHELNHQKNE